MILGVEWLAVGILIVSVILVVSIFLVKHWIVRMCFGAFLLYIGFRMTATGLVASEQLIALLIFGIASLLSGIALLALVIRKCLPCFKHHE